MALCAGGAFGQMHGAGGQSTEQAGPPQQPTQQPKNEVVSGPDADRTFLKKAMEANVFEIQMGQLALQKSTDDQVRHFALQMTDDHGKMLDVLKQAAQQLNVPVPAEPSKSAVKSMDKMKAFSGDAFDQAYIKEMVKAHKDDDKLFKEEARNTTSPQLKQLVTEADQTIESHLQQAQQLEESKAKGKG